MPREGAVLVFAPLAADTRPSACRSSRQFWPSSGWIWTVSSGKRLLLTPSFGELRLEDDEW